MTTETDPLAAKLAKWSAIEQAATPGPWEATGIMGEDIWADAKGFVAKTVSPADAGFIAEARTAMPRLRAALAAVLEQADGAHCLLAACGTDRHAPAAWDLDPADIRETIRRELLGPGAKPGPEDCADPDEPTNREVEPEPPGWYDVPDGAWRLTP
jgi:hypothetical protein